jgi:WD40 repeat protein
MPPWLLNPPRIVESWRNDVLKFEGHTSYIMAIIFSPDDKLLGTCSLDGTARVWDTTDASCSLKVSHDKPKSYPGAMAFSSDSSKVAVAYRKHDEKTLKNVVVEIYSMKTGTSLRMMQCPGLLSHRMHLAVAFAVDDHHNATVMAVADVDYVQVWRSVKDSNILIQVWTSHFPKRGGRAPMRVDLSQDASLLCCSRTLDDNVREKLSINVLDPKIGAVTSRHDQDETSSMNISGRTLVCRMDRERRGSGAVCLRSFEVETPGASTHVLDCYGVWREFSLANAKDRVAFNTTDSCTVYLEAIPESKRVGRLMQRPCMRRVAVAPRGNLVADWTDGCLTVLDTKGLVTQRIEPGFDSMEGLWCLTISPDCRYIALGHDGGVTIWNIETEQRTQYNEMEQSFGLAFSNDNESLACVGRSDFSVWNLESKRKLLSTARPDELHLRPQMDIRVEFSADGQDLLVCCGRFHIATATWTTLPMFGKEVDLSSDFWSLHAQWVQFDGEDLMWIPEDYRANNLAGDARGTTVALGQEDGSVMVLAFDPSML